MTPAGGASSGAPPAECGWSGPYGAGNGGEVGWQTVPAGGSAPVVRSRAGVPVVTRAGRPGRARLFLPGVAESDSARAGAGQPGVGLPGARAVRVRDISALLGMDLFGPGVGGIQRRRNAISWPDPRGGTARLTSPRRPIQLADLSRQTYAARLT